MDPNLQWQPPAVRPPGRRAGTPWLPAALIGSAIVVAAGLIGGALILKNKDGARETRSTCQAWSETWGTLKDIPALPNGWNWNTPNIDMLVQSQNVPVGKALDAFEAEIATDPPDVARAARDYVAARRAQMKSLANRTYTAADGEAVDTTLEHLNELCGIRSNGRPI
jgi:hypothetical protein